MSESVADTILRQLGGRPRLLAMTGANRLLGGKDSLSMRLPNATYEGARVSGIRIVLAPSDTYTLHTFFIRGTTLRTVATEENVFCDNIRAVFTRMTGLHTSL